MIGPGEVASQERPPSGSTSKGSCRVVSVTIVVSTSDAASTVHPPLSSPASLSWVRPVAPQAIIPPEMTSGAIMENAETRSLPQLVTRVPMRPKRPARPNASNRSIGHIPACWRITAIERPSRIPRKSPLQGWARVWTRTASVPAAALSDPCSLGIGSSCPGESTPSGLRNNGKTGSRCHQVGIAFQPSMPRIRAASIDEHKALTRSALLDAAKALIQEAGTADLPLGEIALAAGVGRTTLYDYFTDRDDLIATLVEEELPGVVDDLLGAVPQTGSAAGRLADLASKT